MAERTFLHFQCNACPARDYVEAFVDEEGHAPLDDTWPIGWLIVQTCEIGLPSTDRRTFCTTCKMPVLAALGYENYKSYVSVVKENAEEESRSTVLQETDDIPFYLTDEDSN